MKQQVNLYYVETEGAAAQLNFRRLLEFTGYFVALLAIVWAFFWWRQSDQRNAIATLEVEKGKQQETLATIEAEKAADRTEEELSKQLEVLRARRNAKLRVISVLTDRSVGNVTGFSAYLEALAARHVDGVWVRSLSISGGGAALSLVGTAVNGSLIPDALQEIGKTKIFAGQTFSNFEIQRSDDDLGHVVFSVSTGSGGEQ